MTLLANLRNAFQAAGVSYGLTITLPSSYWYLQNFNIVALEQYVDWFNVMEYDLHGTWDSTDVYIGPYVQADTNLTQIDQSLQLLWRNNIDPSKVVLGLGFYGRSFALSSSSCTATGCPFSGASPAGACTQSAGTLSYPEIMQIVGQGYTPTLDSEAAVQILVYGTNWVAYDDATTLQMKLDYANSHCLGGSMVWAASLDTSTGTLAASLHGSGSNSSGSSVGSSSSGPGSGNLLIGLTSTVSSPLQFCQWTNCAYFPTCPSGSSAAQVDGSAAWSVTSCPKFTSRAYCCPTNNMPVCHWTNGGPSAHIGNELASGGLTFSCTNVCPETYVSVSTTSSGKFCLVVLFQCHHHSSVTHGVSRLLLWPAIAVLPTNYCRPAVFSMRLGWWQRHGTM